MQEQPYTVKLQSYFPCIVALVSLIFSSVPVASQATVYPHGYAYQNTSHFYGFEHKEWIVPGFTKESTYTKVRKRLSFYKDIPLCFLRPLPKKEGDQVLTMVSYQAEDAIVFDAKKNILSLHGTSVLDYDKMKLEANKIDLNQNANTITAEGTKDAHNKSIETPIFTYQDVTKNKYGKESSAKTRIFFMEKIHYNINTKRALVHKLLTNQEESIVKSEQVKKEDEETFYAKGLIYTTCALECPHFYIRAKRAKMIQDQQITSGPLHFYFDDVPTPLGCMFGTLFLEGKRTHGTIPPELTEDKDRGFGIRKAGYYINFKDYVDFSILGSIYANGTRTLENELRYQKRYLCSGSTKYIQNVEGNQKSHAFNWEHKTLAGAGGNRRRLNANIRLHSKEYKSLDNEAKKNLTENRSSGTVSYSDKLGCYALGVKAVYNKDYNTNFTHLSLPEGTLNTTWHPFKGSVKTTNWLHKIRLKHQIDFENHFQNGEKEPRYGSKIPSGIKWNSYIENGMRQTLPISATFKVFSYISLEPTFTYREAWYWQRLDFKEGTSNPKRVPGFNRVYNCDFGGTLSTGLFWTHHFNPDQFVQGFRIATTPKITFTYTPDCSKKEYFELVQSEQEKQEKKYVFEGLRPVIDVKNRAVSKLNLRLENRAELKLKKEIDPNKKEKKQTKKIDVLNLNFETGYDFKAKEEEYPLDNITMDASSSTPKIGEICKARLRLKTIFDPYRYQGTQKMNDFSWNHGEYWGKITKTELSIQMDFTPPYNSEKKKKKTVLSDNSSFTNKIEEKENKTDFDMPWKFSCAFNRQSTYDKEREKYNETKYIKFEGTLTLLKKWQLHGNTTYNFTKNEWDPSDTEISIQRDLHCWQLGYKCHPLEEQFKYEFSLGVKANILKAVKLPTRKREFNKLK